VMKLGKPIKYIAVSPEEVINRVKKQLQSEADRHIENLKELKISNVLTELNLLYSQGISLVDPTELSGSIKGRNNIYNQMESMIRNAEKSIVLVASSQGLIRKYESLKNALNTAKKKNVDIKIAAPLSKEHKDVLKDLSNLSEIRHTDNLNSRFLLVDNKELLFMLLDDKDVHSNYDVGVWLNSPFWANTLTTFFKAEWKNMRPVQQVLKKTI